MKDETREPLRTFTDETGARADVEARVRQRLAGEVLDAGSSRTLLSHLPTGDPPSAHRVRARVHRTLAGGPAAARRKASWTVPVLAASSAALGVGFAAVLALGAVGVWWTAELDLAVPLVASADRVDLVGLAGVSARISGTGTLAGTSRRPIVVWDEGTIELEVDPDEGPDLVVTTSDATVTVTGTVFRVERDVLGTMVSVTHGTVEVRCGGGEPRQVGAGERHECVPTTPAGLLARARAQVRADATPAAVLETVDRGLATAEGPIEVELGYLRLEQLARAGRLDETLAEAEAMIATGTALRRADVARMGARAALVGSGCLRALPLLELLEREGTATPADLDALERCRPRR